MKFAFLPNYFKKIGIICFCASWAVSITASAMATIDAYHSIPQNVGFMETYSYAMEIADGIRTNNYWVIQISGALMLVSILFYMLAKEKVDDEYMDVIRWESLRLALIISIGIVMFLILVNVDLSAKKILLFQFIAYLITFKVKKSQSPGS